MNRLPKVSVSLITYNAEAYVADALMSILKQKVNFGIEVIIGDDCSSDKTREIIRRIQKSTETPITTIFHDKKPKGIPGKVNFVETIHRARGEYVALLDGDDFWTDPFKLQKQVDFMDMRPEYSLVFHQAKIVFEDVVGQNRNMNGWSLEREVELADLISDDWFIHSGSIFYRRALFPRVRPSFMEMPSGDVPLVLHLASKGKVGYLPHSMSVYRKNLGSISLGGGHQESHSARTRKEILLTLKSELGENHELAFLRGIAYQDFRALKFFLKTANRNSAVQPIEELRKKMHLLTSRERLIYLVVRAVFLLRIHGGVSWVLKTWKR